MKKVLVLVVLLGACREDDAPVPPAPAPERTTTAATARPTVAPAPKAPPSARPSATTAATATATATALASATASASAAAVAPTASAAAAAQGLLAGVGRAARFTVQRMEPTGAIGTKTKIEDPKKVAALLEAIGMTQKPGDSCPRCVPSYTFTFEDAFGTRLGSLGVFCEIDKLEKAAALHDALSEKCESIELDKPEDVKRIADEALPAK
jgi:hypothetical protein